MDKFELPRYLKTNRETHRQLNQTIEILLFNQKNKKPNASHLNIFKRYRECADYRYKEEILFWTTEFKLHHKPLLAQKITIALKNEAEQIALVCDSYDRKLNQLWGERSTCKNGPFLDRINDRIRQYSLKLVLELQKYRLACNKWHRQEIEFYEIQLLNTTIGTALEDIFQVDKSDYQERKSKNRFSLFGKESKKVVSFNPLKTFAGANLPIADRISSLEPKRTSAFYQSQLDPASPTYSKELFEEGYHEDSYSRESILSLTSSSQQKLSDLDIRESERFSFDRTDTTPEMNDIRDSYTINSSKIAESEFSSGSAEFVEISRYNAGKVKNAHSESFPDEAFRKSESDTISNVFYHSEKPQPPIPTQPAYTSMGKENVVPSTQKGPKPLPMPDFIPPLKPISDRIQAEESKRPVFSEDESTLPVKRRNVHNRFSRLDDYLTDSNPSPSEIKRAWMNNFEDYILILKKGVSDKFLDQEVSKEIGQIRTLIDLLKKVPEEECAVEKEIDSPDQPDEAKRLLDKTQIEQISLENKRLSKIIATQNQKLLKLQSETDLYVCTTPLTPNGGNQIRLNVHDIVKIKMYFIDGSVHGHNINTGEEGLIMMNCLEKMQYLDDIEESPTIEELQAQFENQNFYVPGRQEKAPEYDNWGKLKRGVLIAVKEALGEQEFLEWKRKLGVKSFWKVISSNYTIEYN